MHKDTSNQSAGRSRHYIHGCGTRRHNIAGRGGCKTLLTWPLSQLAAIAHCTCMALTVKIQVTCKRKQMANICRDRCIPEQKLARRTRTARDPTHSVCGSHSFQNHLKRLLPLPTHRHVRTQQHFFCTYNKLARPTHVCKPSHHHHHHRPHPASALSCHV